MKPTFRFRQAWTVARLQLLRVFFSRRSFWIYLLALFPTVVFFGHGLDMKIEYSRMASQITPAAVLESIQEGQTDLEILERAGKPILDRTYWNQPKKQSYRYMRYFDGKGRWDLNFKDGVLQSKQRRLIFNLEEDRLMFAAIFQFFYLRLAIFFSCLGIFMNLFRGEMLDKTLHFWFLVPARREVLLAGKYLAGLIAAVLIFAIGTALCFCIMLWPHAAVELNTFWQNQGPSHLFWYVSSAILGCIGYGSVFLAAGLLLRNPIIPAVVILFWESINGILPAMLQKLSVLYYAQSLCPVPVPTDPRTPLLIRLLMSPADPPSPATAIFGLLAVTALVLWAASRAVRRLEINYSTD